MSETRDHPDPPALTPQQRAAHARWADTAPERRVRETAHLNRARAQYAAVRRARRLVATRQRVVDRLLRLDKELAGLLEQIPTGAAR